MILRRKGNKKKLAARLIAMFPPHTMYIEPFFGSGSMFFMKPKSRYNILNDLDGEVFNLFEVVTSRDHDLLRLWAITPIHEKVWAKWKQGIPHDPVERAVRFLQLSNLGFMGDPSTLRYATGNSKRIVIEHMARTKAMLWDCEFTNCDFRNILRKLPSRNLQSQSTFIYADPPYLDTTNNYVAGFAEQDCRDLMTMLAKCGSKFAMSEFDHPFVIGLAAELGLNVTVLGERKNLSNRRTEILVTNYKLP